MYRIPSELRSQACLGESSTRMGDLLGSPRVAPLVLLFSIIFLLVLFFMFFLFCAVEGNALSYEYAVASKRSWVSTFFVLKIHHFDIQARCFHPYSILKAFLRSFRLILLHLIVVLCVLSYWVACGHV
jgi:hypothetical protein